MEIVILIAVGLVSAAVFLGLRSVAMGIAVLAESVAAMNETLRQQNEQPAEESDGLSFDEKVDRLKDKVRDFLASEDPDEWERREQWHWGDWKLTGWSIAEWDRESREKSPNLLDLPEEMQKAIVAKREAATAKHEAAAKMEPSWQEQAEARHRYVEEWLQNQPKPLLRQQHADGLLSDWDAENLIEASALDDLLGPAYEYDLCYRSSRDRLFHTSCQNCGERELHHLPPGVYPNWLAAKGKLPQGASWSFWEVWPCLRWKQPDSVNIAAKRVFVVKLTVPVGPFRFERNVCLSPTGQGAQAATA